METRSAAPVNGQAASSYVDCTYADARLAVQRMREAHNTAFRAQLVERQGQGRFTGWRYDHRSDPPKKPPVTAEGGEGNISNRKKLCTLDVIEAAILTLPPGTFNGLGFVLNHRLDVALRLSAMVGIDLDGCIDRETGRLEPWALRICDRFGTRTEISPSGAGVKLWLLVASVPAMRHHVFDAPAGARQLPGCKAPGIEVYVTGRYFTVTGQTYPDYPETVAEGEL